MSARAHERVAFDNPPTHYQRQTAVTVNGHGRRYGAVPYLCVKGQQLPPTSTPLAVDIFRHYAVPCLSSHSQSLTNSD